MPRYLIERNFDVTEEAMPDVGRKSKRIALEEMPEIVWEHSRVVIERSGLVTTFCVYGAPSERRCASMRRPWALIALPRFTRSRAT